QVTVVLSGEGADEILAGYSLYRRILQIERARGRAGPLLQWLPLGTKLPFGDRVRSYLHRLQSPLQSHYRGVVKGISSSVRLEWTGEERFRRSEELLQERFGEYFREVRHASALNKMLYADAKVWLPENLLLKADKMTMATAIELRVPFLD